MLMADHLQVEVKDESWGPDTHTLKAQTEFRSAF